MQMRDQFGQHHGALDAHLPGMPRSFEAMSVAAGEAARFGNGFVRPLYKEGLSFASVPGFIEESLLGSSRMQSLPAGIRTALGGQFDHVILVFFDAFGWESFQRFRDQSEFLKEFDRSGIVLRTTSQFPSTTAVHVTSICSGLPVFEHHVCGWDYYEPKVGRMIRPLKFTVSDETPSRSLVESGYAPPQVLPPGCFVPTLLAEGVSVRSYGPQEFNPSLFGSRYMTANTEIGYSSVEHGIEQLLANLTGATGKSYSRLYTDQYDQVCHKFGPGSAPADSVAKGILSTLDKLLSAKLPPRTLLMLTADHGQVVTKEGGVVLLNQELPRISDYLKRDSLGAPIRFSGGCRYLFLHPQQDAIPVLQRELTQLLKGAADVYSLEELGALGMLGPTPIAPGFAERLGSIAILPYAGYSVSWFEPPLFGHPKFSEHGGASIQEMETPLALLAL